MSARSNDIRSRRLAAAGLAIGALGVLTQAVAGVDLPGPVPPGAVILAVTAALTVLVRWPWISVVTAGVSVLGLLNVAEPQQLSVMTGSAGPGVALGKWLLVVGALTALVASSAGLLATTRQRAVVRSRERVVVDGRGAVGPSVEDPTDVESGPAKEPAWPRRLQVAGLLVLAPVCAEYLAAYDDTTGDALRLVGSLVIFVPLYGAPALLIREVCRRHGLGWAGIILLAAAFGLIEAGIVDQSLFSLDYRHLESWDEGLRGTFIGPLGLSAYNLLNFVGGHVVYSICAPIALVEAFRPSRCREPWLTPRAMVVVAMLYLAASALVLGDSLANETSHASPYQVVGSSVVIVLLIVGAFRFGRPTTVRPDRRAPRVRTVFVIALVVATVYNVTPPVWPGVALSVALLVVMTVLMRRAAQSPDWSQRHIVAIASAALLSRAVLSFTYFPLIGDVSAIRKYGHSSAFLILVTVICLLASRAAEASQPSGDAAARAT